MKKDRARELGKGFRQVLISVRRFFWHLLYQKEVDIVGFKDLSQAARIEVPDEIRIEAVDSSNEAELKVFVHTHLAGYPDALRRFEDCARRGFGGMIARHNGVLVGFGWWASNKSAHPQVDILQLPITDDDVYGFDLFIGQEFRGRHAGLQFVVASGRYFHARGYKRLFTIVRTDNLRSLKVHSQWGWQETGRRAVIRIATVLIYCNGRWHWRDPVWF